MLSGDTDRFAAFRRRMVEEKLEARGIHDQPLLNAIEAVPRHLFVAERYQQDAYIDAPLPLAEGQTISQPYMVAAMLAALALRPSHTVLEVGTGTGWQAAVLSRIVREVYTVERYPSLAATAQEILQRLEYLNVHVVQGDGSLGLPQYAPFDRIIVAAAAPRIPTALLDQLADGGQMIVPVGDLDVQQLRHITRRGDRFEQDLLEGCRFVPLIGKGGFQAD